MQSEQFLGEYLAEKIVSELKAKDFKVIANLPFAEQLILEVQHQTKPTKINL